MIIKQALFAGSSQRTDQKPKTARPEFAFIGRSNVGKSSLINRICNQKGLAHTSATPGKTQLVNHFLINDAWYLVDLPGYGFARISKKEPWIGPAIPLISRALLRGSRAPGSPRTSVSCRSRR